MDTEDNDIGRKDSGRKKSTFKVEKDKRGRKRKQMASKKAVRGTKILGKPHLKKSLEREVERKRKQMASIKAVRETKLTGKRTRERKREREMANKLGRASAEIKTTTS